MDHRPCREDIIGYYLCTYGNGPDDWAAANRMLQEQEGLSKEEYIAYWKRMIREYNEAIDTGKYRPQQKSSNKEFFDMIGYDDLAFARD